MNSMNRPSPRIASIGDCMIELSAVAGDPELRRVGFGGDTCEYGDLFGARLGIAVDYVTALGDDAHSERMLAAGEMRGSASAWCNASGVEFPAFT